MIYRKTWEKTRDHYRDIYTGYFLFGIIPLFIARERFRSF